MLGSNPGSSEYNNLSGMNYMRSCTRTSSVHRPSSVFNRGAGGASTPLRRLTDITTRRSSIFDAEAGPLVGSYSPDMKCCGGGRASHVLEATTNSEAAFQRGQTTSMVLADSATTDGGTIGGTASTSRKNSLRLRVSSAYNNIEESSTTSWPVYSTARTLADTRGGATGWKYRARMSNLYTEGPKLHLYRSLRTQLRRANGTTGTRTTTNPTTGAGNGASRRRSCAGRGTDHPSSS
ncbi:unnamed protein product, partial [Amoebophrya sp. A25]|eukprot:GSA25T00020468001.1